MPDKSKIVARHLETKTHGPFGSGHHVRDSKAFMEAIDSSPEVFATMAQRQLAGRPPHAPLVKPSNKLKK